MSKPPIHWVNEEHVSWFSVGFTWACDNRLHRCATITTEAKYVTCKRCQAVIGTKKKQARRAKVEK